MRLTAQEEYGLRCLLQVARRAPAESGALVAIREVAEAEGLSLEYAAKLLRVLRQAGFVEAERGAAGGFRMARPAAAIALGDVMGALDTPLFGAAFCADHAGQAPSCVHQGHCSLRPLWTAIDAAVSSVLAKVSLADLLAPETAGTAVPALAAGVAP